MFEELDPGFDKSEAKRFQDGALESRSAKEEKDRKEVDAPN